jgi:TetR/AcrR family transcriptional repressor of nem operon
MARPRTYVREEVVRRATDLFARKGYEGAHLEELVRVTGLNRFSLYKEFGGKEGLFQAALDAYLERMELLGGTLLREPLGVANLRAFYAELLAQDFPHGCLAVNTIREKHVVPKRIYAKIERFAAESDELFRRNLAAARERGELAADTDVVGLAKILTALNMGLMTYGVVAPGRTDPAQVAALLDRVLR